MNYQVWMEGFHVQGTDPMKAQYLGKHKASTFEEACKSAVHLNLSDSDYYYNEEHNTYYGCHFFDNEDDARKSFG